MKTEEKFTLSVIAAMLMFASSSIGGIAGYEMGRNAGIKTIQEKAASYRQGRYYLDHETGEIKFQFHGIVEAAQPR